MVADRGADHLHVAEHVGDADQHQQHREQRGPEPAVLQLGERLQRQHHRAHPHTPPPRLRNIGSICVISAF